MDDQGQKQNTSINLGRLLVHDLRQWIVSIRGEMMTDVESSHISGENIDASESIEFSFTYSKGEK